MDIATQPETEKIHTTHSRFSRDQDGYALVMTLVALPLVVGLSAFVIDGSRVANLHTDVQNAVDAMALAGARELDGAEDAIERAEAAIAAMGGNEVWFGDYGIANGMGSKARITYTTADGSQSDVTVSFLGAIPDSDDTAIGDGACEVSSVNESNCLVKGNTLAQRSKNAAYVRVKAVPRDLRTIFKLPGLGNDTVSVGAEAVATYSATVCDVAPLFICNPFENYNGNFLANGKSFAKNFGEGALYGRQINLSYGKNGKTGPGNFGFLRVNGNGANDLGIALARNSGTCQRMGGVDTKPGANVGKATTGLNTRFGFYSGVFSSSNQDYAPDINTRAGHSQGYNQSKGRQSQCNGSCSSYDPESNWNYYDALAFPDGDGSYDIGGGTMSSSSDWDIETYWDITHGDYSYAPKKKRYNPPPLSVNIPKSFPGLPAGTTPSRFDVYSYEIDNDLVGDAAPNGETGISQCHSHSVTPVPKRRELFIAVINCNEHKNDLKGAGTDIPTETFAKAFLTKPAVASGNYREISMEIIDVAGSEGLGTADSNFREEAELVR